MKVALLSPIAWRTPPRHYGPWERVVSLLCEGLVEKGVDVTLFATGDSLTRAKLEYVCKTPYEEDSSILPKVWECLHIAHLFEQAGEFDLIHNNFDFLPLSYSRLVDTPIVTTIHGFSSPKILPVYKEYADRSYYVAISNADRSPELEYIATVYHGIDVESFEFSPEQGDYLLYFGRIHPDKGTREAIEIARRFGMRLFLAGIIQDEAYFREHVAPFLDGHQVTYLGSVGPERRSSLLGGAYALLHPISFEEPFGLSVVEAMACGTPVVAFNRGSMPEVIRDGVTGYLVGSVEEAVEALARIPRIERAACRQWVEERFSRERMVNDYLEVYRKVLEKEKARARRARTPWGKWEVLLDAPDCKVKRITVEPGRRLSYQKHFRRQEHWYVVSGQALVTLDGRGIPLQSGQAVDIPRRAAHRIENTGESPLIFIETQTGSYFGEDDIIRLEDDYGRA
jgi:glycosyltransferase involved in cell wall biosynthesis/mannose-6-phosphate isomerase-like protein (cupin superfamily)